MSHADLAAIVDLRFDVLEVDMLKKYHDAKCENLTAATDYCNFIADGANLCAQAHSTAWWKFTKCMYSLADPNGDTDHDTKNPLAHVKTFDQAMTRCAARLHDYGAPALRRCVYGDEAKALRQASAAKTAASGLVWVNVNGKVVPAPNLPNISRATWQKDVLRAVCGAYKGEKPASCRQDDVVV